MISILYANGIGATRDVGKNGTFRSAHAWHLLLVPFKATLVLKHEFLSQNVLL
jgi:hypothetical protein